jgi:hypothetical protein
LLEGLFTCVPSTGKSSPCTLLHIFLVSCQGCIIMEAFSGLPDWVKFVCYGFSLYSAPSSRNISHSYNYTFVCVSVWLKTTSPSRTQAPLGRKHLYFCLFLYPLHLSQCLTHSRRPMNTCQANRNRNG